MSNVSINLVTKCIKNNSQNFKINLTTNNDFEQNMEFKFYKRSDSVDNVDNADNADNADNLDNLDNVYALNDIIIKINEIINIPSKLNDIFDNLLENNYYLFGLSKNNGFLLALLYVISNEFKFKSEIEQNKFTKLLCEKLCKDIDTYFSNGKYTNYNFKKQNIIKNLQNNTINNDVLYYISDYYNINIIILNYIQNNYIIGKQYDENKKNIIIIHYNEYYIPLVHMYGESPTNLIFKCIINKLQLNKSVEQIQYSNNDNIKLCAEEKLNNNISLQNKYEKMINSKKKIKALSNFKLCDLQEICNLNNIDIKQTKTKKLIYNKILEFIISN